MSPRSRHEVGRRHVVVVTTSYPTDADDSSGHFVAAEVRALRANGDRVSVLAPRVGGSAPPTDPDLHWLPAGAAFGWPGAMVRLRANPSRAFGALRFVLAARRELSRLADADRVIAHFVIPSAWPIACFGAKAPLEVVAHGSDVRVLEQLPRIGRRGIARALADADIRCVSEELRERLCRALGPGLAKVRVAPSPLDLGTPRDRESARAALGIDRGARLVVIVGRLLAEKRVEVALRALELVPSIECAVIGDGPEQERLVREFPTVRFLGRLPRSETLTFIAAADVLLSASRLEGAPSAVREARALGTRVVTVPAGDLRAWSRTDAGLSVVESHP